MTTVRFPIGLVCLGLILGVAGCGAPKGGTASGAAGLGGGGSGAPGGSTGAGGASNGQGGAPNDASASAGAGGGNAVPPGMTPVQAYGQLKVVGTQLQDQSGHPVQLKGVSSQWLNYESKTFPESKAAIQYARDNWKLSVIRAAMGVDVAGGYLGTGTGTNAAQATMLSKVNTIVGNAIDLGIYVIVDWRTSDAVTATTTQATAASAFFTSLATQYGSTPNIIYEPYNEPNKVTWAQIKPYHQAVVAAIRAVDPDNLIVLGTPTYSQDVDLAAADPVAGTNLLYTLHFYACTHKQALRDKATKAISLGLPLFVTEFGATPADGGVVKSGDNDVCEGEANTWFSWMAQNNISGASWKLDQCTDSSCILTADAPVDGPWSDNFLTSDTGGTPIDGGEKGGGHGLLVVNWMRE
ncbi:MAG TPA: glycoside hydrolase family 5 protein [Polyangia bacterium]